MGAILRTVARSTQAFEMLSTPAAIGDADVGHDELAMATVLDVPAAPVRADNIHASLRELTAAIIALQASQASSATKTALTAVVLPLLVSIIMAVLNPIADHHVRQRLPQEPKALREDIAAQLLAASALLRSSGYRPRPPDRARRNLFLSPSPSTLRPSRESHQPSLRCRTRTYDCTRPSTEGCARWSVGECAKPPQ